MKQDDFDIPEVFRRAMEEAGWRGEQEEGGGGSKVGGALSPVAPAAGADGLANGGVGSNSTQP